MVRRFRDPRRRGTILPLLAVCMIGLFGFCGLAIDLGLLAVSRTQSQNAADAAALAGCRMLSTKPGATNSNLSNAVSEAKLRVTTNNILNQSFTTSQIKIKAGQYLYNPTSQLFSVYNGGGTAAGNVGWTDVTSNQSATPSAGGQWTAIQSIVSVSQPTYFMRVFGVTGMPVSARATTIFRPVDVAFVLDMTGSMTNSCHFGVSVSGATVSNNPDTNVPVFAHYNSQSISTSGVGPGSTVLVATGPIEAGSGGTASVYTPNNYTTTTGGGPPLVGSFVFNGDNLTTMTNTSTVTDPSTLMKAFSATTFSITPSALSAKTTGPIPAPASFASMTDSGTTYVGDRYRRADGSVNTTETTWAGGTSSTASTRAAINALELLGYGYSGGNVLTTPFGSTITTIAKFRDPTWEKYGYDLDIVKYRAAGTGRGTGNPKDPVSDGYVGTASDRRQVRRLFHGTGLLGKDFLHLATRSPNASRQPRKRGLCCRRLAAEILPARGWDCFCTEHTQHPGDRRQFVQHNHRKLYTQVGVIHDLRDQLRGGSKVDQERTSRPATEPPIRSRTLLCFNSR